MPVFSGSDDLVVDASAAALVAAAAVIAQRRAGMKALIATIICTALLLFVGYLDWRRLASKETPLVAYAAAAIGPTLIATLTTHLVRRRPIATQWLVVAASFALAVIPALVIGTYVIGELLPF